MLNFPRPVRRAAALLLLIVSQTAWAAEPPAKEQPSGEGQRTLWQTSQVRGRPEPPLPFRASRIYPHVAFKNPTCITSAPGTDRLFIAEGAGQIYSLSADQDVRQADPFLDANKLVEQLEAKDPSQPLKLVSVYGLTFHPNFAENRYCYVTYVVGYRGRQGQKPDGTRVTRLKVKGNPPQAIVDSETEIFHWLQGGHNGGCIKFGPDGMLYISTGDGSFAFPPDTLNSGQDVTNVLSALLRIDVDHPTNEQNYSIPADNPFVDLPGARGEIWAYGMRNPWKFSFDRKKGECWVGDVGWELWEMIYRVKPGDNYGWSLVEASQPVHTERERGPTPITPPAVAIPHTDGASVTGGFVYRGEKFPDLQGQYIFGDWETRRIWSVNADAEELGPKQELVEPTVRIVGFAEQPNGELLLLDYDAGTINELVRSEPPSDLHEFPRKLSDSGLFSHVDQHEPAPGLIPFSIQALQWADHATAERYLGLPGDTSIGLKVKAKPVPGSMFSRQMDFPQDAVLTKTLSLEMVQGDPSSKRRIETQLLHFNGYDWRGYTYRWNDAQTDAELVGPQGLVDTLEVIDASAPGGRRQQQWKFSSRNDCIRCHNPWAEFTLAFNIPQLNREHNYGDQTENQITRLRRLGVLQNVTAPPDENDPFAVPEVHLSAEAMPHLADPFDATVDLEQRGRAYLHANCAHCHRENGGGSARIHIPYDVPLEKTEALSTRPTQGTFNIFDAEILAPGDPYRSVLYYRMAKIGPGHMPHVGSSLIDEPGLALIHDWIRQLPVRHDDAVKIDRLVALEEAAVLAEEAAQAPRKIWKISQTIAQKNNREKPTAADEAEAAEQEADAAVKRVEGRIASRNGLIAGLLEQPPSAMMLARAQREGRLPESIGELVIATATQHENLAIRDLFESFLPDDQRTERLGETIDAGKLLELTGDPDRGRELFFTGAGIQCRNCHRVGEKGIQLGPDLTLIGKKLDRAKLLESILEPSKTIDPKFSMWLVETDSGKVLSGLLIEKTENEVVLRDTQNKEHRLKTSEIEAMFPQQKSLMPDLLLRDMTAAQVADLLSWLESLKE
ncbi:PQQ-dependent sugar dehydrogenase [Lignipirellula cremea]|uniref:Soluble aldose sugar dehydrogenase YliI n=1 Tax=Lignipirellula cremea TaxID=2528010 RepID=A0A518DT82_9BACT|nr:PQQ-dependent sugar dehydrogenase [Lignipirellula cremea]QDU95049.1 Soluble aldose sugar dehydrogenase YliI precursor [Lignipirellula cremea]